MALLDSVISLVTPCQCLVCGVEGALLCTACAHNHCPFLSARCFKCQTPSKGFAVCVVCRQECQLQYVWSRTSYKGTPKQLLHDYKFARAQFAAPSIAKLMAEVLPPLSQNTLLVPIPTATGRYRQRGYDHAHLLAKALGRELSLPTAKLLTRIGQTRQVGASKALRHTQLQNAFRTTGRLPPGQPVLLVDDVTTTGASLESAAQVLCQSGAKDINAVTFAQKIKSSG
jgi:ComF family protein